MIERSNVRVKERILDEIEKVTGIGESSVREDLDLSPI